VVFGSWVEHKLLHGDALFPDREHKIRPEDGLPTSEMNVAAFKF
jgi:hypothetical protein